LSARPMPPGRVNPAMAHGNTTAMDVPQPVE